MCTKKMQIATWQHKKATKTIDYTAIVDQFRTVSWSNDINQTGVMKPAYWVPTFQ